MYIAVYESQEGLLYPTSNENVFQSCEAMKLKSGSKF